jgi:hypothetical protein
MWRTLGAVESVVGVLMCGLSASSLFAMVTRLVGSDPRISSQLAKLATQLIPTPKDPTPASSPEQETKSEYSFLAKE